MPDLKLNTETAIAAIGKQLDYGIESLRSTAERLIEDVRVVAAVHADPSKLNIVDADAAVVIDFFNNYDHDGSVTLQLPGGSGGETRLASRLSRGRYRAVILLNKLPEP